MVINHLTKSDKKYFSQFFSATIIKIKQKIISIHNINNKTCKK